MIRTPSRLSARQLLADGVALHEHAAIASAGGEAGAIDPDAGRWHGASPAAHLLVATGRMARTDGLRAGCWPASR